MTREKLVATLRFYDRYLEVLGYRVVENAEDINFKDAMLCHVRWMAQQSIQMADENAEDTKGVEKAMRWLGYIQGILRAYDVFRLEELKTHSRSTTDFTTFDWTALEQEAYRGL